MTVDIYADPICPWCYIGRHRLDRGLALRPHLRIRRRWHPFELNPDMPPNGMDRMQYLAAKFGGREHARQVYAMIEEAARRDGLPIRLDLMRRTPNTFDAHRLAVLATARDRADALMERLFAAAFVEGLDIGDRVVLVRLAGEAGLDRVQARAWLDEGHGAQQVHAEEQDARRIGLHAVPCFIFNQRYVLAGAQEPQAFLPLMDAMAADTTA